MATLSSGKADTHEEGERTRRYCDVIAERFRDDLRLLAEGQCVLPNGSTRPAWCSKESRLARAIAMCRIENDGIAESPTPPYSSHLVSFWY